MSLSVYLAGGMTQTDWQTAVINECKEAGFEFFNPREHQLDSSREYTLWDLFYVKRCDILFAYMDEANPSGIGLSLEVGFAKSLGKMIILVDEKSPTDSTFGRSFLIVRESASIVFESLDSATKYLQSLKRGTT